jgi:hypothetical protein
VADLAINNKKNLPIGEQVRKKTTTQNNWQTSFTAARRSRTTRLTAHRRATRRTTTGAPLGRRRRQLRRRRRWWSGRASGHAALDVGRESIAAAAARHKLVGGLRRAARHTLAELAVGCAHDARRLRVRTIALLKVDHARAKHAAVLRRRASRL